MKLIECPLGGGTGLVAMPDIGLQCTRKLARLVVSCGDILAKSGIVRFDIGLQPWSRNFAR